MIQEFISYDNLELYNDKVKNEFINPINAQLDKILKTNIGVFNNGKCISPVFTSTCIAFVGGNDLDIFAYCNNSLCKNGNGDSVSTINELEYGKTMSVSSQTQKQFVVFLYD